ncbi:hypothetical protein Csa_010018 [Cucumis sativus]|nr:hypothetical protein Csa_010018 [Cucumis sativus]
MSFLSTLDAGLLKDLKPFLILFRLKCRECPGEVKEAISSLIFAASRCGEFPELQEIRRIFELKFGAEFASSAIDLRNNCGVSTKMIQKFSTKQPSAETKLKVLKEIASENGIPLHLEQESPIIIKAKQNQKLEIKKEADLYNPEVTNTTDDLHEVITSEKMASELVKSKKFKDVASATEEPFQSAAYAALAAKAAINLSKSKSQDIDSDHEDGSHLQKNGKGSDLNSSYEPKLNTKEERISSCKIDYSDDRFSFEKICPVELESCSSQYEDADMEETNQEELPKEPAKESTSFALKDSDVNNMKEQSSKPNSIFYNESDGDKITNTDNEVASGKEISEEDIRVHESK